MLSHSVIDVNTRIGTDRPLGNRLPSYYFIPNISLCALTGTVRSDNGENTEK